MNGEIIGIETLEELYRLKKENKELRNINEEHRLLNGQLRKENQKLKRMKSDRNLIQANIDLLDKNKVLERDTKILAKRIDKAVKYIGTINKKAPEEGTLDTLIEILQNDK